jgi:cytidylate kinase
LTQREATQRVLASDRARAEYLSRYYGVNWLDPQLYDLVLNAGRVSIATAIQLVVLTQVQHVMPAEQAAPK